jgi:ABC-2 type transport system ATP-binding protein
MTPAIRARGLTRAFGAVAAVRDLDLEVAPGEIFALVGPDGGGKTTVMRLLTAILPPTSGDAWVGGHHVTRDGEAVRRVIGYMSQRFGLYADLTVLENIHFYADIYGVPRRERDAAVDRLLGFSQLLPFKARLAGQLSGGMKQKLGLACALVHTPRVLLLDEPTNGVDPVSRREFWRILAQLSREGVTVFVSTAYLDEAERAGRIGLLHQGSLLAIGTLAELRRSVAGTLLEVRTGQPRAVAAELRRILPRAGVTAFGDRLHVQVEGGAESRDARALLALVSQGPHGPGAARVITPTLEDVFLAHLQNRTGPSEGSHESA